MKASSCGHLAPAAGARVCAHLTTDNGPGCFRVLTGVATRYDLLCKTCAEADTPELVDACTGCFEGDADLGWRGSPEILRRDRDLGGTWTTLAGVPEPLGDRCLAALPDGWLAWTADGLVALDPAPRHVATVDLPPESPPAAPALHTTADGRFAAAVTDYGRYGTVVDLASGAVTLALDRQDYGNRTTRFPVAFLGPLVVAATDWKWLDAFDPATSRLLTERVTDYDENPEHYFDYFFGALLPSPSGRSLLVDGWVWQPEGIPLVLDCAAWFAGDRHAPEHGQALAFRDPWDVPMAWVDDATVALQRIGDDLPIDGIQLHDARTGRRTGMFAGSAGRMWGHGGLLYVTTDDGFEVWDPAEGARVGFAPGFHPLAHRDGTFAELRDDQLRTWTPQA
ncbi:hypothetical protein [Amycolatopsis tolypomycina]|uniref:hypothetical protein n=1 Tax=Amycolatopsis tolypomycina TaxID=208445 RepID=UPI00115FB9F3|nr:hypothetical protein [Amycolatopsis tolypomycina]